MRGVWFVLGVCVWCVLGACELLGVCGVCCAKLCVHAYQVLASSLWTRVQSFFLWSRHHKTYAISCGRFARSNGRLKTGTPSCRYFCKPNSLSSVSTIVQYI